MCATIPIRFSYTQFELKRCSKKVFCGEMEGTAAFHRYGCNKSVLMCFFHKFSKIVPEFETISKF